MRDTLLFFLFLVIVAIFYTIAARRAAAPSEALVSREENNRRRKRKLSDFIDVSDTAMVVKWVILGIIVGLLVIIPLGLSWAEVGPAQTMAVYDPLRGGIQPKDYAEGWHLVAPWSSRKLFSKRLQEYTMSIVSQEGAVLGDDAMVCQTKEGLSIKVDATTVFRIPPQGANRLWKTVGPNFLSIIIRPSTRNIVRQVVAKYGIMEVYSNAATIPAGQLGVDSYIGRRKEIEQEIEQTLREQFAEKGIDMVMFLMRNVAYDSPQFEQSIVEKQVAQQAVTTQQYQAEAAKIRAQARVVRAEGEAKAIQLKAQALRIDPRVVSLEWVEQLKPDEVMLLPKEGVVPFIQIPGTSGQ